MRWVDKLERRFGRYAIPQLGRYLIVGQVASILLCAINPDAFQRMVLLPDKVFAGQVWRVVTFIFATGMFTGPTSLLFFVIHAFVFILMCSAVEATWGTFRFNVYLAVSYLSLLMYSLASGHPVIGAVWLVDTSVFFAFAFLFPDFVFQLYFVIPVKVKYLALITCLFYFPAALSSAQAGNFLYFVALLNFLLFLGPSLVRRIRAGNREVSSRVKRLRDKDKAMHQCEVCGKTEKSHPEMEFRYCSKCERPSCYCMDHILSHEHVSGVAATEQGGRLKAEGEMEE